MRINQEFKDQIYFVTFSVNHLYYIFDRHNRFQILEDSFVYCQKYKGLIIYAFVFMLNHLHFLGQAPDLIAVVKDMKTFLSHQMQKNIIATEPKLIDLFKDKKTNQYHFWQNKNYPYLIDSDEMFEQKYYYIINNPVRKEYVHQPEDWKWSSASKIPTKIKITQL